MIVGSGIALWVVLYCTFYALNLLSIRLTGKQEFVGELKLRWKENLKSAGVDRSLIENYVARAADLQIHISMPGVLRETTSELLGTC